MTNLQFIKKKIYMVKLIVDCHGYNDVWYQYNTYYIVFHCHHRTFLTLYHNLMLIYI